MTNGYWFTSSLFDVEPGEDAAVNQHIYGSSWQSGSKRASKSQAGPSRMAPKRSGYSGATHGGGHTGRRRAGISCSRSP